MLILTRRIGESLIIQDNIVMTVLGVKGNQVRIGVNAPIDVSVHREEIYNRIKNKHNIKSSTDYLDQNNQHQYKDGNVQQRKNFNKYKHNLSQSNLDSNPKDEEA